MTSIRTQYRLKRVELIKDCIMLLVNMLTLEKKELEKSFNTFIILVFFFFV